MTFASMSAVILAGGLGTRLRSVVSDRPKPMAEIGGKPFLEYLVRRLLSQDFADIVLCVSYMKENIIDYFASRYAGNVRFAIEERPLGTAGALRNAEEFLGDKILLLNGDTFTPLDYKRLLTFHDSNRADATMTLARGESSRFGKVKLAGSRVVSFDEKGGSDSGLVNAGVYVIERDLIMEIPKGKPYSIEREFFPSILQEFLIVGYRVESSFIDIGEPGSYAYLANNPSFLEN